jgi:hypothetical protein
MARSRSGRALFGRFRSWSNSGRDDDMVGTAAVLTQSRRLPCQPGDCPTYCGNVSMHRTPEARHGAPESIVTAT